MNAIHVGYVTRDSLSDTAFAQGSLRIGPLHKMTAPQLRETLQRHRLTTGNDAALDLHVDADQTTWLCVAGDQVTGYLHDCDGFGLEACDEAVESFLQEVGPRDRIIRISGEYFPDAGVLIRSSANYLRDDRGLQCHMRRTRHTPTEQSCILSAGGPMLVPLMADPGEQPRFDAYTA